MSTPINHHFVSRCQSDNFFNRIEGKIFLYDKVTRRHFSKQTTKSVFSEDDSNTRLGNNDELDRISLEKDLKDNFEDVYFQNFQVVKTIVNDQTRTPENYRDALVSLTKYGIAGELRHPDRKRSMDGVIGDALFKQIMPFAAPELKGELEELKRGLEKTKYSNQIEYSKFAEEVIRLMGGINCIVYSIKCDKVFILPDKPAITLRAKINEYFNPDIREIAMVGIPLSSKIFLHSQSVKLGPLSDSVYHLEEEFPGEVEKINYGLYMNAHKHVACESKDYLTKFLAHLDVIAKKYFPNETAE